MLKVVLCIACLLALVPGAPDDHGGTGQSRL